MVDFSVGWEVHEVEGSGFMATISAALAAFRPEITGVLIEEGEQIMAASKEIVPFDEGVLSRSGGIYDVSEIGDETIVTLGYGGDAASYAVDQHETPPNIYRHSPGRSWKYLETPFYDAVVGMEERIAAKLAARISNRFQSGGGETFGGAG